MIFAKKYMMGAALWYMTKIIAATGTLSGKEINLLPFFTSI